MTNTWHDLDDNGYGFLFFPYFRSVLICFIPSVPISVRSGKTRTKGSSQCRNFYCWTNFTAGESPLPLSFPARSSCQGCQSAGLPEGEAEDDTREECPARSRGCLTRQPLHHERTQPSHRGANLTAAIGRQQKFGHQFRMFKSR